jgi:hypothetical protein
MNTAEEEKAQICRELAEAMKLPLKTVKEGDWNQRTGIVTITQNPIGYMFNPFDDPAAFVVLIEWAVRSNLAIKVYPFRGAYLGEANPFGSSTYFEIEDNPTAQEAIVRAIHAAVRAREATG